MAELTVKTIDQLLDRIVSQESAKLDLSSVEFVDPYALLLLGLALRYRLARRLPLRVQWPRSQYVRSWMDDMGFAKEVRSFRRSRRELHLLTSSALQPITLISKEEDVSRLVCAFDFCLSKRYPLTNESRNAFVKVMLELFQNIPQHSNATGEVEDPHGLAAMQDYTDSIFLGVADMGIGLRRSLSLRDEFALLSDKGALKKVVFEGMSRFVDPGHGGELQRIAQLVRKWDGLLAIRSGEALVYMDVEQGDVYDAPFFPGVQIAVRLPRHVFGIEAAPVDNRASAGFNE